MKRISVNLSEEQAIELKERARVTGVLQSEIIRRAIDAYPSAAFIEMVRKADAERAAFVAKYKQPVLITPKASENNAD